MAIRKNSVNLRQIHLYKLCKKTIIGLKLFWLRKKRTNKWLAEQLGKDPATVSKWCTNSAQPGVETLFSIAECLDVKVKDLLNDPVKVSD